MASKIPRPFKPMLAGPMEPEQLTFPKLASPKIDGVRAIIKNGVVLSRALKPIPNGYVQELFGRKEFEGFDGELTVGPPSAPNVMQATTSGVMRHDGEPDVRFHVFDLWNSHEGTPFEDRLKHLYRHLSLIAKELDDFVMRRITYVKQIEIASMEELNNFESSVLKVGYEGAMLRDPKGPYKHGRSTTKEGYLLKVKRFSDAEAIIEGVSPAMHNAGEAIRNELGVLERSGRAENLVPTDVIGKFHVVDSEGRKFDVAPGILDHGMRKALWMMRESLVGKNIKFKYFPHGEKDVPRHPSFLAFRDPIDM